VVEAIGGCVAGLSAAVLGDVVVERADVLASLVPAVAAVRPAAHPSGVASPDAGRRQAYDAVTGFLRRLSRHQPLVLMLDDLHNVGLATVDLLHYLVRTLSGSALLIVATVRRDEGAEAIARLSGVSTVLDLEPFDDEAVTALVTAVGQQQHLAAILDSTSGHPLFVVETLNALATGETGIPLSLQDSVLSRVAHQGREAEALLRVAAVLGPTFGPADLVAMTGESLAVVTRICEDALRARLLSVSERSYAFSYDVTREVLYRTTPDPSRTAYHALAADVLAGHPEAVARHAAAAGQTERAAEGWLLAGQQALARFAVSDAESLLDLAIDAAQQAGRPELVGCCHIARGRAREAMLAWPDAIADYERTVVLARSAGDERLEMVAEWELGGDSRAAVGRSVAECVLHTSRARLLAHRLNDPAFEALAVSRLAILASNNMDFVRAVELGAAGVALGRASGDELALSAGLDGLKTAYAYLGDIAALAPVVDELVPLLRRLGDVKRLQWALAEASFVPLAKGQWSAAAGLVEEAVALSRSGGSTAYEAWFLTSLGHVARLQGRTADALAHGQRAMAIGRQAGPAHAWCEAIAVTSYATTLLRAGRKEEATDLLLANIGLVPDGHTSTYRVRFMAALAEATGDVNPRQEAEALLSTATVPAGQAWLLGWDVYASVARAQAAAGDPAMALATVGPVIEVARRTGWTPVIEEAATLLPLLGRG
jgi:tetratricopeptide (TPR) repeat protein